MTIETGNTKAIETWAANGGIVEPDLSKIDVGFLSGERPAFQTVNFLFNRVEQKINALLLGGIPEWDSENTYPEYAITKRLGILYLAVAENTNSQPPSANWNRITNAKSKLDATVDPTVDNDETEGYAQDSKWFNTASGEIFMLIDATDGAAVWVKTTLTLDELGTMALANTIDYYTKTEVDALTYTPPSQPYAENSTAQNTALTTYQTITSFDPEITPSSDTKKVKLEICMSVFQDGVDGERSHLKIQRNIDGDGWTDVRSDIQLHDDRSNGGSERVFNYMCVDSPATELEVEYRLQFKTTNASSAIHVHYENVTSTFLLSEI
jgi:hypothetical protein